MFNIFIFYAQTITEVIDLSKKYDGLSSLINSESEAKSYYNSLPEYVREQISTRGQNVNSYQSLRDYAENLLRGDI